MKVIRARRMENAKARPEPIPIRGQPAIWDPPAHVIALVRRQLAA